MLNNSAWLIYPYYARYWLHFVLQRTDAKTYIATHAFCVKHFRDIILLELTGVPIVDL